jgi:hypothetical protein
MRIEPLSRFQDRDFALLTPGHRRLYIETKWGKQLFTSKRDIENALAKLATTTCYVAAGLQQLRHTTGASSWCLSTWRGRDVRMTHIPTGVKVTSLQSTLLDAADPFAALSECLTWLRQFGIAPGSISSMSWKLLRASLSKPVIVGFDPEISARAFFGGRQEISKPDIYHNFKSLDIKAAYPTAMAAHPISLSLRSVSIETNLDPTVAGLAEATVYVPDTLDYAPLPVRINQQAIQFQYHELSGVWTWRELHAAASLGCDVTVTKCWAPRVEYDLFGNWWYMAQEGRALIQGGDQLAKAVANATWGQFSMRGDERGETYWSDDKGKFPYTIDLEPRRLPHVYGLHVAAEITSRVRTQTLLEGLYGAKGFVAHVDTDGIIITDNATLPANNGDGFGQWRVKENILRLDVRAPQFYRYTKPEDELKWYYVASGQSHDQAVATFNRNPDKVTKISWLSRNDVCLAAGSSRDTVELEMQLSELRKVVA